MKRDLFVFNQASGRLYVDAKRCGIPLLIVLNELGFSKLKGSKRAFVDVVKAIKWHTEEVKWAKDHGERSHESRHMEAAEKLKLCALQVLPESARTAFQEVFS